MGVHSMQETTSRRGPPPAAEARKSTLSIGSDVTIVGSIQFDGPVEIEGTVQGDIRCANVSVSRYGTVMGTIVANDVTVAGGVNGSIYANRLVLKPDCDVEGEIFHRELSLEQGCYFDGKSRPHQEPLTLADAQPEHKPELRLAG